MDELRKNHILQITFGDNSSIEGVVLDYSKDRVLVLVDENSYTEAVKIKELDLLNVIAHTSFGLKKMQSSVISTLDGRNCLIIENNPTIQTIQRREHVRAIDDFAFKIKANDKLYTVKCINLSAGGIAFKYERNAFQNGEKIEILFSADIFSRNIKCNAEIIKAQDDFYVAMFNNLNDYDESKIVKRVFQLLAQK